MGEAETNAFIKNTKPKREVFADSGNPGDLENKNTLI